MILSVHNAGHYDPNYGKEFLGGPQLEKSPAQRSFDFPFPRVRIAPLDDALTDACDTGLTNNHLRLGSVGSDSIH